MRITRMVPVVFLVGGCAAVNVRAPLPDIEKLVSERGSFSVSWPENPQAANEVESAASEILSRELTAESAVRLSLLKNRNLQAIYEELGVAQAELVQAGLLPNPVLNANVRFGLGPSGTGSELGLVQDLVSALQIPLRKRVAAANLERVKAQVAGAVLELALEVKGSFFALQGALQMLELRRTVAEATSFSREIAERQHTAGNISELELRTEQALHEESKVELGIAEAEALSDREKLNGLLGLWGKETQWSMAERLPTLPKENIEGQGLESRAVLQRLDLIAARAQGLSQLAELRRDRLYGLIPDASIGIASEREVEGGWSLGPALDLPIPLFDQRQTAIASGAARVRAANERFAALAIEIRADVRRAWTKLQAARQRAAYYERVLLPLKSQVVKESQRQYNAMQISPIQLVQARRDEVETGRRYIETLTEYWLSRTELERAVGGELDSLGPPAESETPGGAGEKHHHDGG